MKTTRFDQSRCIAAIGRFSTDAQLQALVFGLFLLALVGVVQGAELRPEVMSTLREATFEVVMEKPSGDSLSYEKPLPYDLVPYQQRMDNYYSIGTAFAMEGGVLVSAAHVFDLGSASVRDRICLRDDKGRIIAVDKILKYSLERDFIVFSVKGVKFDTMLKASKKAAKNQQVFAVGNALGEGVIARDGLYTSDTPEADEGRWQWIRFSAAASPGNSGGPLVDRDGHVLGVVIGKSENENLNFALPLTEVYSASSAKAEVRQKAIFRLDITDDTLPKTLDETIDLPAHYLDFGRALQAKFDNFNETLSAEFLAKYRDNMFPYAAGAQTTLYDSQRANFPRIIAKQKDGTWAAMEPAEKSHSDLGNNGYLSFGSMGSFLYLRLQAPDTVPAAQLRTDSKLFMDLILKGVNYTRHVGAEQIRVTSLGPAKAEELFVDAYQRKWQVRRWNVEFSEQQVVSYALPVPGGYAVILNSASPSVSPIFERDMRTLADFAYASYYGTLRQWKDFLAAKDLLPAAFGSIRIDFSYGKDLRYASQRVAFSYPNTLMKVNEDSDLELQFSYFKEGDRVVWDVTRVVAGESKSTEVVLSVTRHAKPPQTFSDANKRNWETLVNGRVPYSGEAFFDKSNTVIGIPLRVAEKAWSLPDQSVLYSAVYVAEGSQQAKFMRKKLADFRSRLKVGEYAGGAKSLSAKTAGLGAPIKTAR